MRSRFSDTRVVTRSRSVWSNPNCGHCGRFTTWRSDSYTRWGGSHEIDPPDPTHLCETCAQEEYQRVLAFLLREGIPPQDARGAWVPSRAWRRARAVARAMFRHGHPRPVRHERVRYETSGTRQVWWCRNCDQPERHPAHDAKEAHRLSVRWCKFERKVGRTFGTFKVQEWCACGWTTGALPQGERPYQVDYLGTGALMQEHVETSRGWRYDGGWMYSGQYQRLIDGVWVDWDPIEDRAVTLGPVQPDEHDGSLTEGSSDVGAAK